MMTWAINLQLLQLYKNKREICQFYTNAFICGPSSFFYLGHIKNL